MSAVTVNKKMEMVSELLTKILEKSFQSGILGVDEDSCDAADTLYTQAVEHRQVLLDFVESELGLSQDRALFVAEEAFRAGFRSGAGMSEDPFSERENNAWNDYEPSEIAKTKVDE